MVPVYEGRARAGGGEGCDRDHRDPRFLDCTPPAAEALQGPGRIHPSQALRQYREKTGIPARLVVVGMASNGFTIADPADGGMLDVVGFDTATPRLIAEFVR